MGRGIAQVCALAGFEVSLNDINMDLLTKGKGIIEQNLAKGVQLGKVAEEARSYLPISSSMRTWERARKKPI